MTHQYDFAKFFPFEKMRDEQAQAIEFALNSFINEDKRFVVLELGVGIGKSATGVTIGKFMTNRMALSEKGETPDFIRGSYILTVQKILQDQYIDDFSEICSIKSSSNYACKFFPNQSCAESLRVLKNMQKSLKGTPFEKSCGFNCCYKQERQKFVESELGITNYAYFLAATMYADVIKPREVLVIDEAHNLEVELSKFIELTISANFASSVLNLDVPEIKSTNDFFIWLRDAYREALKKYIDAILRQLGTKINKINKKKLDQIIDPQLATLAKKYEAMDKHICKLNRFIAAYTEKNWIVTFEESLSGDRSFKMKPIDVSSFTEDYLFKYGRKVVLMSATILDQDTYCKSLGIDIKDVAFIKIDSPFSSDKRPIHYMPVGRMSANEIDKTLPNIVIAIKEILKEHPQEKGLIHCTNYKVSNFIQRNILNSRLLFHKDAEGKTRILKQHNETDDPTVLISPSMGEGVDLSDDLSRFQIFCKVPYPYLGDEVTKRRMQNDKNWYSVQTARNIIQATGRSVRNSQDYATTYIIDTCFQDFYHKNKHLFPQSFQKSVILP